MIFISFLSFFILNGKMEEKQPSLTWKIKGFPAYFRIGHVKRILDDLNVKYCDVFKQQPSQVAYVRFISLKDKMDYKNVLLGYKTKKIKELKLLETDDRPEYEVFICYICIFIDDIIILYWIVILCRNR